jgi:tetratricopeptide (TPR) repeat protein
MQDSSPPLPEDVPPEAINNPEALKNGIEDSSPFSSEDVPSEAINNPEKVNTGNADDIQERVNEEALFEEVPKPSMAISLFISWILPIVIIAIFSRFAVDIEPPPVKVTRPITLDTRKLAKTPKTMHSSMMMSSPMGMKRDMDQKVSPSTRPSVNHPSSYRALLKDLESRQRLWKPKKAVSSKMSRGATSASSATQESKKSSPRHEMSSKTSVTNSVTSESSNRSPSSASSSEGHERSRSERDQLVKLIAKARAKFREERSVENAIALADALRMKDIKYHDGGMGQKEALNAFDFAINETLKQKVELQNAGEPTNLSKEGTTNVAAEVMLDNAKKSVDGLLCSLYVNRGKLFFMANMFERAVESYTRCLEIEPLYLDALSSRGSSRIILGHYEDAAIDYLTVIHNDEHHFFNDAFTGIAKILAAKEDVVPGGWDPVLDVLTPIIDQYEKLVNLGVTLQVQHAYMDALNRLHHVLFTYHDVKTKDREMAWRHLTDSYRNKMARLEPYNFAVENQKLATTKAVFHKEFWPKGIGSDSDVPIFIIGFVRSGSTLLERILDAHPLIVGTGEDSVFNGRLEQIRNEIVQVSLSGDMDEMKDTVEDLAASVVKDMRERWKAIETNTESHGGSANMPMKPRRFADKMLTNYYNVGFIHMLFPHALILHVARNPMDVLWSAYKHEFPSGGLDYTSDFYSLANMYHQYREVISHWDTVLPGRVTHVRYEDLVNDTPGMARAIINATKLPWDESVLAFHKKKHAVNTLSTTQVRKGIYNHSLESWKKYEAQLQPLKNLVGQEATWSLKTTLSSYSPPAPSSPS